MVRENCKDPMTFPQDVIILVSLAAIGFSIWSYFSDSATPCQKAWEKPLMILGVFLLVWSILVLVGRLCRVKFISYTFQMLVYLFYLGMFCLSLFTILVTNRKMSRALFGRDGNYSHYLLNKYVVNAEQIKSCLVDYKYCQRAKGGYFHIQSSCCKPPTYCGLEFHNATYWTMPKAGPTIAEGDCKIWSNVQSDLCFNCQSCTTALLERIKEEWKVLSLIYFGLYLFFHLLCCAVYCDSWKRNRSKGYQSPKVYPA